MGTAPKVAGSSPVSTFLSRPPHVRPRWLDRCPHGTPPVAKCFAASSLWQPHMLQLFGDAVRPHLALSFGTPSSLCTHTERNLNGSNPVTWEAMRWDLLSQFICLETADRERLSLGWHMRDGTCARGNSESSCIFQWSSHVSICLSLGNMNCFAV
jgi:hypothetical protein